MKRVKLTQGRLALVDDEDFRWLLRWRWYYGCDEKTGYAARNVGSRPRRQIIRMHVAIMKRHQRWERGKEIDHINTCGCDNRKENLRLATRKGQSANIGLQSNNTSGITGVDWDKKSGKWRVRIGIDGKQKYLGLFIGINDAFTARQKAEYRYFGEFQHDLTNVCPLGYTGECFDCAVRLKELQSVS